VGKVIDLSPDCVTIYQMEIPFNTTIYKTMKEGGKLAAPVADWPTKRRWADYAFSELENAGYTVTSAYTAVKDPEATKFVYRDRLWTGADMVSLGVASFGHLGGIHYQNLIHIDDYIKKIEEGGVPVRRALLTTEEERFLRELILQFKLGRVNLGYFRDKFGEKVEKRFSEILADLEQLGDISREGDELVLTREALLRVDSMLHRFFLPKHRDSRYV
jgi:oxygen-independent coproporphyrinogen-3 oxidase